MQRAGLDDKATVLKILLKSFKNDPYMNWLLKESNRRDKHKVIIEFVVDETFRKGEIYLSDDYRATALWNSEKKEKISFNYIWRNLSFLFKFGIKATVSIIKKDKFTHDQYPKESAFYHLFLIGVLPEVQGKGLASELINPMIENKIKNSIPLYLETANPVNVEIYKKKGFSVFKSVDRDDITIYFMRRQTLQF